MEKRFHLKEHGTTVRTEIMAGITTFMAMAYILMVNAGMFADLGTVSYGAIYIATAISAVIGTVLIGLLANLPLAQASGMGLNRFALDLLDVENKDRKLTRGRNLRILLAKAARRSVSGILKRFFIVFKLDPD